MAYQIMMWDDVGKRFKRSAASAPDFRAGGQAVANGAGSVSVTFSTALPNTNYTVLCTWMNLTDSFPQFQPVIISAYSTTGFTATWNVPVDSANYTLNWQAIAFS